MGKLVSVIASACVFMSSIAPAQAPCPKVGFTYPWMIDELMPGDSYADVYIDIDKSGWPLACRTGRTNIEKDDLFWVCNAFIVEFRTKPPAELAKGERTTIQRTFVDYGPQHRKAERKARKEFFEKNPSERPECYRGAE